MAGPGGAVAPADRRLRRLPGPCLLIAAGRDRGREDPGSDERRDLGRHAWRTQPGHDGRRAGEPRRQRRAARRCARRVVSDTLMQRCCGNRRRERDVVERVVVEGPPRGGRARRPRFDGCVAATWTVVREHVVARLREAAEERVQRMARIEDGAAVGAHASVGAGGDRVRHDGVWWVVGGRHRAGLAPTSTSRARTEFEARC